MLRSPVSKNSRTMNLFLFILSIGAIVNCQYEYEEPLLYDTFPEHFFFGVATSAFQVCTNAQHISGTMNFRQQDIFLKVEGGYNEGGKSASIWDTWTEEDGNIAEGADAKVACDSYHKYLDDVQLIKNMGLGHYRVVQEA